ncbi:MAG: amino acid adenylation domain-containing protein, partial [bacterium]|nr:amino acid adenylation domain-containing protein [bacterium]
LGEIETRLQKHPMVMEAVVVIREDKKGNNYICAYYIPAEGDIVPLDKDISSREESFVSGLREYLQENMPNYMIPSYFVKIEKIPLTSNGKIDIRALPEVLPGACKNYQAPRGKIEKGLVKLWADILGKDSRHISLLRSTIGIDDNFFSLGGHSLNAMVLILNIHKKFKRKIPLTDVFKYPTIRKLGRYIGNRGKDKYTSIKPAEMREYYSLSSAQRRLYVLYRMNEKGTTYNMPFALELTGKIDRTRLTEAAHHLFRRHDSLRTSFVLVDDEPVQLIHEEVEFKVEFYERTARGRWILVNGESGPQPGDSPGGGEEKNPAYHHPQPVTSIIEDFLRPFDLSIAPLLRIGLIKIEEEKHLLVGDMHHIISDGVSTIITVKEFISLYRGYRKKPLRLRYKDYSQWQNGRDIQEGLKPQEAYWCRQFEGEIPVLDLPVDFPRPVDRCYDGKTFRFSLTEHETEELQHMARSGGATLFIVLLTMFTVFLSKISGQEDIVVGTPVAGREHADLESIIGLFINTLALRNFADGESSVDQFLNNLKERVLTAFENQDYHFEDLVEKTVINRDTSRSPLFDAMFVLDVVDLETAAADLTELKIKNYEYDTQTAKFDLTLTAMEEENTILMEFEYATSLFKPSSIERFVVYLKQLISSVIKDGKQRIRELEIIPEDEKEEIIINFNSTRGAYPRYKALHEMFEDQAYKIPTQVALAATTSMGPASMTYNQLNKRADQLAFRLWERGVSPNGTTIVGLMMERSMETLIGIFGILKAGGAYLPIDPRYPPQRINYMLADSSVTVLVIEDMDVLSGWEGETIFIEHSTGTPCCAPGSVPAPSYARPYNSLLKKRGYAPSLKMYPKIESGRGSSQDAAYIIYTSGSTGKPKGVVVEHISAVNLLHGLEKKYPFGKGDTYLLKTPFVFDVSVSEVFGWYLKGGRLAVLEIDAEKEPRKILDAIEWYQVTHINFVPSMFAIFAEALDFQSNRKLTGLKYIFLAGEALGTAMVHRFREKNKNVVLENLYGPTEATVYASGYPLKHWQGEDNIPIGIPLANTQLYILDRYNLLQPIGISGELCIGGEGLARGYLNNPTMTAEKFIINPVEPGIPHHPSQPSQFPYPLDSPLLSHFVYKTGDLARWMPEGEVQFLGRIDHQIKIRGYRIELGEIENQLTAHEKINEAVVVARETKGGDYYLCAYFVPVRGDIAWSESGEGVRNIRKYLGEKLPEYMVPTYFVSLDRIPLKPNGKIDRDALPAPGVPDSGEYVAPADETEEKLTTLWAEVLEMPQHSLSTRANFFHLGGHSLKATVLTSRIGKVFNVEFSLSIIFGNPTVRQCARFIKQSKQRLYDAIEPVEEKDYYPQSSAQKRLFILEKAESIGTAYNMPLMLQVEGNLDLKRLDRIFQQLVERHECFRTAFFLMDGEPVQQVHEPGEFAIEHYRSGDAESVELEVETERQDTIFFVTYEAIFKKFIRPFDLYSPPLLRAGIVEIDPAKWILAVDMHHIVSDGFSARILTEEFIKLYNQDPLATINIRYRDFACWQNHRFQTGRIDTQEEYWKERFDGGDDIPKLNLPIDFPRPGVYDYQGDSYEFMLDQEEMGEFKKLAMSVASGVTLYMNLLAIFNVLLYKYSGQEDMVVGGVIAGRRHEDLQNIVGMFVNTLPMRNSPGGSKTYLQFLAEVKNNCLSAFDNQDLPFEVLVERLEVSRDSDRHPLFDVCLTVHDSPQLVATGKENRIFETRDNVAFSLVEAETHSSKFDLTLDTIQRGNELHFSIEYCIKLFKPLTIQHFARHFINAIRAVTAAPSLPLSRLCIISEEEKEQLLVEFNDTASEYPNSRLLHHIFEEQAGGNPDRVAVIGPATGNRNSQPHLSYGRLDREAVRLAALMRQKGIVTGSIVAILVEPCVEMLTGILGILKAGAAYLPVDPDYPPDRIRYMLSDSQAKFLVSTRNLEEKIKRLTVTGLKENEPETILMAPQGAFEPSTSQPLNTPTSGPPTPADVAYIIYTSGSTGKPKGVTVQHSSFVNRLYHIHRLFAFNPGDVVLQKTSIAFDVSVCEFFRWMPGGGRLVIMKTAERKEPGRILRYIEKNKITIIEFLPSLLNLFLDYIDDNDLLAGLSR